MKIEYSNYEMSNNPSESYTDYLIRFFDIIASVLGLIICIPIMVIFGILVRIETPGDILYSQERLGRHGKKFTIYKIRSMYCDAEKNGAQWAVKQDIRITAIGKIIRKTRIDELPQLFNVLKGEMSIVGPRPEREVFASEFSKILPDFAKRLDVKPGLTGLAQVNGGYDLTPEEKLKYDLYYIKNRNVSMDFKILIKTVKVIMTGSGAL